MRSLYFSFFDNPILLRELRRRMRGKALVYSIITYIILMTLSTVLVLLFKSPSPFARPGQDLLNQMVDVGQTLFLWIVGIQSLLVLIVAPTITAGMTTGEKERKTFDFLRVTTITRWMYVMGCFLSTAFYVALALICALPLLSLTFLYGGVAMEDVVRTLFTLLGGSCILSAFGLYISSVCERTRTAQGIIVFLIFAVLFGGFIVYNQLQVLFAGALAQQGGASDPGAVFFFDYRIPTWVLGFAGQLAVAAVFLLLAARKLFEPEDTRAFAHWQFALLFAVITLGFLGFLNANAFTREIPEVAFLAIGYALLLLAVHSFAVGRMEVGDEVWHLKRLLPILRPLDQTIPFLLAVGLFWYWTLSVFPSTVSTLLLPAGFVTTMMLATLSSYFFFCMVGRATTGVLVLRRPAGNMTLAVMAVMLVVVPLVGWAGMALVPPLAGAFRELVALSPFALLVDVLREPGVYTDRARPVGLIAAVVYVVLGMGVGIYGEIRRYLRWRGFDYHYDMPAG